MPRRTRKNATSDNTLHNANTKPAAGAGEDDVAIEHDDLCPICQLLLYKPVRTRCNHSMCEVCMAQWADVSITSQMTMVGLEDHAPVLLPHEIETRCPMCRTHTNSALDTSRAEILQRKYPSIYRAREAEAMVAADDEFASTIETLTVYIGNEHSEVRPEADSNNKHQWKFFVRPSRTDLIEEVQIFLVSSLPLPRPH
jgi:hypothetical protein